MRPKPRPWRSWCIVCGKRSKGGYESETEARAVGVGHLWRAHHVKIEDLEAVVGHPVEACKYQLKETA